MEFPPLSPYWTFTQAYRWVVRVRDGDTCPDVLLI